MLTYLTPLADRLGLDPRMLILGGLFIGSLLVFLSLVRVARDRTAQRVQSRMRAAGADGDGGTVADTDGATLFLAPDVAPRNIARAFLPSNDRERNQVRRDLTHAGFTGPNAVVIYYALRVVAGLVLPALLVVMFLYREVLPLPDFVAARLGQVGANQLLILLGALILIGFYGPAFWVSSRANDRKHRIELGFPNALDLMQVSIETGLGFDAALARVSTELRATAPEISLEFTRAQQEILAGRDRDAAYQAMAARLVIDEAYAFVNVVLQSIRFGTSMSQSLLVYAQEMRMRRELRAQEKANKLPVMMSAVMAMFMMPALLIVTIGPVVLRYMQSFPD
jgi:tight adherence protein C